MILTPEQRKKLEHDGKSWTFESYGLNGDSPYSEAYTGWCAALDAVARIQSEEVSEKIAEEKWRPLFEKMLRMLQGCVNKMETISAPFRHGEPIDAEAVWKMYDRQIEAEKLIARAAKLLLKKVEE